MAATRPDEAVTMPAPELFPVTAWEAELRWGRAKTEREEFS
jgi:hypothetical protein